VKGASSEATDTDHFSGAADMDLVNFVEKQRPEQLRPDQITSIQMKGRDIYGLLTTLATGEALRTPVVPIARPATPLLPPAVMPARK